ncbi:hypothetical protein Syun_011195 [Stephania yunnanensis]|uniref:RING-type E3 ubiquitin transferase n=1 Tax=Stephania yunnanensis TaxID=152371 RepID=A0AAP0JZB6_9MAGN
MAGMLPGVECARRRRCHQGGGATESSQSLSGHGRTRRPSFCLYTSNFDTHVNTSPSLSRNQSLYQEEKLVGVAREAKERLDERLRNQRKSTESSKKQQHGKKSEAKKNGGGSSEVDKLHINHNEAKKGGGGGGSKRMSWANRLRWKVFEQEECAVCLDEFSDGEKLMELPCAHRFHSRCLVPWLESNAHCPCCRMGISNMNVLA